MPEKSPIIIMVVRDTGVSVMTDHAEALKPEQRAGFDLLAAKVQRFAAALVEQAIVNQNARPETVN